MAKANKKKINELTAKEKYHTLITQIHFPVTTNGLFKLANQQMRNSLPSTIPKLEFWEWSNGETACSKDTMTFSSCEFMTLGLTWQLFTLTWSKKLLFVCMKEKESNGVCLYHRNIMARHLKIKNKEMLVLAYLIYLSFYETLMKFWHWNEDNYFNLPNIFWNCKKLITYNFKLT